MNEKPYNGTPPREVTPDGFKVYCAYDEIVEIDSLKPNPRNPNRHPEAQVKMLARIIGEQGWQSAWANSLNTAGRWEKTTRTSLYSATATLPKAQPSARKTRRNTQRT